jgi:hypothetical protein
MLNRRSGCTILRYWDSSAGAHQDLHCEFSRLIMVKTGIERYGEDAIISA